MLTPLLMANAPAPNVRVTEYHDFTQSFVLKSEAIDPDDFHKFDYTFTVTNTGQGYILHSYIDGPDFQLYDFDEDGVDCFGRRLIAPNQEVTKVYYGSANVDFNEVQYTMECRAYQEFIDNPFLSQNVEVREDQIDDRFIYTVIFDSNFKVQSSDYEYGIITEVTYKGETFYVHNEVNKDNEFEFAYTKDKLELDKLSIKPIKMTRGPKYKSHAGQVIMGIIIAILVIAGITVLGIGAGIFLIIFFSIRKSRRDAEA